MVHRFGPFELNAATGKLRRDGASVRLSVPQSAILTYLVARVGDVVSKEALIEAGWDRLAITDNSLEQAISRLRKLLAEGHTRGGPPEGGHHTAAAYIETVPSQGYRFTASVQRDTHDQRVAPLEAQLAPFRAFVQGRTDLDTLDRHAIGRARSAFEDALRRAPDYAPAHVGLAMACGLAFEATTPDPVRDAAPLELGICHARKASALAPASGEAWSTLAFLLHLNGKTEDAAAAAHNAMTLEPDEWRHALRAAYVTWGDERLRAARRVLTLCPGLALAHWLRATVFMARGASAAALEEVRLGCAAQDAQAKAAHFPGVGLHLLHGLILAAHDRLDAAEAELQRELSWADSGQLYARECAANTWYALGAVYLRQRKPAESELAFGRALTIAPRHVSATAALHREVPPTASAIDAAIGQAIILARCQRHADAARVYSEAVAQAPPGSAGWQLPVEPLLNPLANVEVWGEALALVRMRAT